jgi:hypothetical protein
MIDDKRLDKPHTDINYLIREVGDVIARGLAETYEARPIDPVEFMGKWLKNYDEQQQVDKQKFEREAIKEKAVAIEIRNQKIKVRLTNEAEEEKDLLEKRINDFNTRTNSSSDLMDNLQDLCNYVQENSEATGVYIGHYTKPFV